MSRLSEIKKQYPELNITIIDILSMMDTSKTYKYLPMLCKFLGKRFNPKKMYENETELNLNITEIRTSLKNSLGISNENFSDKEVYAINCLTENFSSSNCDIVKNFMEFMDKNLIDIKDISEYGTIDDLSSAITLATLKEDIKEMESQVIKEYEDDVWIAVRPLTFLSSAKYGSSTRWCTTYSTDKQYFSKYWGKGILVYFINKKTGYKFAGYKGLTDYDNEFSFWSADDARIDSISLNIDSYLYSIIKDIFSSNKTNMELCSNELKVKVYNECDNDLKYISTENFLTRVDDEPTAMPTPIMRVIG